MVFRKTSKGDIFSMETVISFFLNKPVAVLRIKCIRKWTVIDETCSCALSAAKTRSKKTLSTPSGAAVVLVMMVSFHENVSSRLQIGCSIHILSSRIHSHNWFTIKILGGVLVGVLVGSGFGWR